MTILCRVYRPYVSKKAPQKRHVAGIIGMFELLGMIVHADQQFELRCSKTLQA